LNVKDFTPKFPLIPYVPNAASNANNPGFQFNESNGNSQSNFNLNQNISEISPIKSPNKEHGNFNKTQNIRSINDMPVQYSYLIKTLNKEKTLQMKI
jgi:hypothetical protein